MVPTQLAAVSSALIAFSLLMVMTPSGLTISPPPNEATHSSASQVKPS